MKRFFWPVVVLGMLPLWGQTREDEGVFEQAGTTGLPAWQASGSARPMLVLPNGFALGSGKALRRFTWGESLALDSLVPEEEIPSHVYSLSGSGGKQLLQAHKLRASAKHHPTSVVYYFGPRGLEFDIEVQPGPAVPELQIQSLDGNFRINSDGSLSVRDEQLLLKPVAYWEDPSGVRHHVPVSFLLQSPDQVAFRPGKYPTQHRLVIDPVVTYASYFGGLSTEAVFMREMPDGTLFIGGNTRGYDFPGGVPLNRLILAPLSENYSRCYISRISPATKKVLQTSYLDGDGFVRCASFDFDSTGRILLGGISTGSSILTTPNAQFRIPSAQPDGFLARVSADGKTLEYSTYLHELSVSLRAGPGDTAYITGTCQGPFYCADSPYRGTLHSIVWRYNIATRQIDQRAYVPGIDLSSGTNSAASQGIQIGPSGIIYLFGRTNLLGLPSVNPLQSAVPNPNATASMGFVTALSPDLRTVLFSTYLGSLNTDTIIYSLHPMTDGSLWVTGTSAPGAIAGLNPVQPPADSSSAAFALQILPGKGFLKAFMAGGRIQPTVGADSIHFNDGRVCMLVDAPAPGTTMGPIGLREDTLIPHIGCLNDAATEFSLLAPVGLLGRVQYTACAAASGGLWTVQAGAGSDIIPYSLKPAAIFPFPTSPPPGAGGLIVTYTDLRTPAPTLRYPQPLNLAALTSVFTQTVNLAGSNFALGMKLLIDDNAYRLDFVDHANAILQNRPPGTDTTFFGAAVSLPAGQYVGRLSVPSQPQPVVSEPFPVIISNLPPSLDPFLATSNRLIFALVGPTYDNSQVLWNGTPLAIQAGPNNAKQIQLPASASGQGELTLINPAPGGGVIRTRVNVSAGSSNIVLEGAPLGTRLPALFYQLDREHKLLYTITDSDPSNWAVTAYSFPAGVLRARRLVLKLSARSIRDFKISTDGQFLYFADSLPRVVRLRTEPLEIDLEFPVPVDADTDSRFGFPRNRILPLAGEPRSVLVVTEAGVIMVYDNDQPRPYTSLQFPSVAVRYPEPLLASSEFVYAVVRAGAGVTVPKPPCVTRFPIDGLGLGPAEDICNFARDWGKYPEMQNFAGSLVLAAGNTAIGVDLLLSFEDSSARSNISFDSAAGLVSLPSATVDLNRGTARYRLAIFDFPSGGLIGHFPNRGYLVSAPSQVLFLDDTMVYFDRVTPSVGQVAILPNWPSLIERAPQ